MAITLVQHASSTTSFTSGTSGTAHATFGSNITAGNCVIAAFSIQTVSFSPTVSSVTTNGSADNWANAITETGHAVGPGAIYVDPNSAGGQKQINVAASFGGTASTLTSVAILIDIFEVSGLATTSPVDKTQGSSGGAGTSWTSGSTATTTNANEFWVGVAAIAASATNTTLVVTGPGAPWNNETVLNTFLDDTGAALEVYQASGYQIVSSTGTATYSGTTDHNCFYNGCVVTLLPSGTPISVSLTVAQVNISAPAPMVVVNPQLSVAQVNINALAPGVKAGPMSLLAVQVNISAPAPGLRAGPMSLPAAQVNISALAPGIANTTALNIAQVNVSAPPVILVKTFALPPAAAVTITAYPVGIPSSEEDSLVPLMATGVYSNV